MFAFFKRLADTRLTIFDIFFLILKIALTVVLCMYFGVLLGILAFVIFNYVLDVLICLLFWITPMNTTDKNVFYDQKTNRCNIMAALTFEKCDSEAIREIMGKKMPTEWLRMRSKVVKVLDNYYFKEMKG